MPERTIRANGIELWCEDFGAPSDPALLLVMGAGGQAILWPEEFCGELAAAGFHVIRYDNRDTGRSTCVDFARQPYTVSDMAAGVRAREARVLARARNIDAAQNHQLAIAASPDRLEALRSLRVPTLVFHGDDDPILPLAHGRLTAEAIPGARFVVVEGMGHDLAPRALARLTAEILAHTRAH